ncbi:MAG: hypothetical protein KF729_24970 [Sandaracinaceae bacterium]|nr:hypothetical protein [Sandaracinaceae bacterium]
MSFDPTSHRLRVSWLVIATLALGSLAPSAPAAAQELDDTVSEPIADVSATAAASNEDAVPTSTDATPAAHAPLEAAPAANDEAAPSAPAAAAAEAPAESSGPRTGFTASLNQDAFFGFYGTAQGTIELTPGVAFSIYTILWTTPSFSANGSGGSGLWTEVGAGVVFSLLDDTLTINPQVGILNGVLLSGADAGVVFDGIVPNLTANYVNDLFQAQVYFGYYLGLREQRTNDFIHYWVNAGLRPTSFLAFGAHFEHLVHSRGAAAGGEHLYAWIGPYAEVTVDSFALRFTAGPDIADADTRVGEFYKLTVTGTF